MEIGSYRLKNNLVFAPIAGVMYRPFNQLYHNLGADLAISDMETSYPDKRYGTAESRNSNLISGGIS